MRPVVLVFNLYEMDVESCKKVIRKAIKKQSDKHGGPEKLKREKENPEFIFFHPSRGPIVVTVDAVDYLDLEHRSELARDIADGIKTFCILTHRTINVIVRDPNGQGMSQLSVR